MANDFDDPTDQPEIRAALRSFGHSLNAEPISPMPEDLWEQLQTSISLEAADRIGSADSGTSNPEVVDISMARSQRNSRVMGGRWVGGLVAASVTLFAVGIGVTVFNNSDSNNSGSNGDVLVADAPQAESLSSSPSSNSPRIVQAGFVPPAVNVMESGTDYRPDNLGTTVMESLKSVGVASTLDMFKVPFTKMSPKKADGMTESEIALRNCITAITNSDTSQALLVDRATFMGKDAGIVIIPVVMVEGMNSLLTPDERLEYGSSMLQTQANSPDLGVLDIWVVGPNCGTIPFDIYSHVTQSLN